MLCRPKIYDISISMVSYLNCLEIIGDFHAGKILIEYRS